MDMKKIFIYITSALAILSMASCVRENHTAKEGGSLTLQLKASDLIETRAEDTKEESAIDHFDYFIFSDEEGTKVLHSGRVSGATSIKFETTEDGEYKDMRTAITYAYVLANYSSEISHPYKGTLDDLLNLEISNSPNSLFAPFVMDSYDVNEETWLHKLKPLKLNEEREETINLTRVAAKLVLNLKIDDEVTINGEKWTPDPETLLGYMWNSLSTATVKGDTLKRGDTHAQDDDFFAYSQSHGYTKSDDGTYTFDAFYSYPQYFEKGDNGEIFFNVALNWSSDLKGSTQFWYKIAFPGLTSILRNRQYNMSATLAVLGGTVDDYAEVQGNYYVADWFAPMEHSGTGLVSPRYLYIISDTIYVYNQDSLNVNVSSSHDIVARVDSARHRNYYSDTVEEIDSDRYTLKVYNDSTSKSFTLTCKLDMNPSDDNYDISRILYKIVVAHEDTGFDSGMRDTLYVMQHPAAYITHTTSNGSVFVNGQHYDTSNKFCNQSDRVYVYDSKLEGETVESYYRYYYTDECSLGVIVNPSSITGGLHDNTNQYLYNIHVTVLPESTGYSLGDPRAIANGYNKDSGFVNPNEGNLGFKTFKGWDIKSSGGYYGQTYTVALGDGTEWLADEDRPKYWYQPTSITKRKTVAPSFIIASSYGKTTPSSYAVAHDRCAAYQEAGYPAGRWRLPTIAEIIYITDISDGEHIPALFDEGGSGTSSEPYTAYWASGEIAYMGQTGKDLGFSYDGFDGVISIEDATFSNNLYIKNGKYYRFGTRCVYDTWYWGEEPVSDYLTTWGSYQMR